MCENPEWYGMSKTAWQRLEHRLLIETQKREGRVDVDERNAYFRGKSILKDAWRREAFEMGLPADSYLDIAALAKNEEGSHLVEYSNQTYLVEVNGMVQSGHGRHREIKSIIPYLG